MILGLLEVVTKKTTAATPVTYLLGQIGPRLVQNSFIFHEDVFTAPVFLELKLGNFRPRFLADYSMIGLFLSFIYFSRNSTPLLNIHLENIIIILTPYT
ncbi:hypothetical protein AKJ51_03780 [candidate division MSBL1 archaeon SCGC-AAA382A20]|uniref:Uncharacterized protein n=1 Tax=candidate division MSBL1 archaeon SCGC-AAA382A20 TaxID=1698280 RepID=A0A133VIY4_9EURY|nr:hypothetical protein AKJ51_03780 [candidate division MSBL1 archaeon SCGC-AAA382A20]